MFDLRNDNPKLGNKAEAYRIGIHLSIRLRDAYDLYSALILKYDILVIDKRSTKYG